MLWLCRMQMRLHETVVRLKLEPFTIHLHRTIDQLQSTDTANIFSRPVTLQEVWCCSVISYSSLFLFSILRFLIDSECEYIETLSSVAFSI